LVISHTKGNNLYPRSQLIWMAPRLHIPPPPNPRPLAATRAEPLLRRRPPTCTSPPSMASPPPLHPRRRPSTASQPATPDGFNKSSTTMSSLHGGSILYNFVNSRGPLAPAPAPLPEAPRPPPLSQRQEAQEKPKEAQERSKEILKKGNEFQMPSSCQRTLLICER
jgi:hypothetical protein